DGGGADRGDRGRRARAPRPVRRGLRAPRGRCALVGAERGGGRVGAASRGGLCRRARNHRPCEGRGADLEEGDRGWRGTLGRLPAPAIDAVRDVASGYSNLEYDLEAGARGSRQAHVESLLRDLTDAEAALVVNNCAAAVLLASAALAGGRELVVSRGQLVEIGGWFRVPGVAAPSGAG